MYNCKLFINLMIRNLELSGDANWQKAEKEAINFTID